MARIPGGPDELYDLVNDPEETNNLIYDPAAAEMRQQLRGELVGWFARWVNPDIDGARELNTGYGQLCRPGIYSDGQAVFAEEDSFRQALDKATENLDLKTGEQP